MDIGPLRPEPDQRCSSCHHKFKEHFERFDGVQGCANVHTYSYANPDYKQGEICGYPTLDASSVCVCIGFTVSTVTRYKP